jgi:hypothetical protein
MNFLNKAKETANKLNDGATKLPGVKPTIPGKPPVAPAGKVPPAPGKPPVGGPGKPPSIPGKLPGVPKPPKAPVAKEEEIKMEVEAPTAPLKTNNPFVKKPVVDKVVEVTKEEKEALTAPPVEENTVKEEVKLGATEEIKVEENLETAKEEPKATTKKTSRSKKKTTTTEVVSDAKSEPVNEVVIPRTEVSFEEAINAIRSGFIDEAWETFKEENIKKLNEIVITDDMTTSMIKSTLSELSLLKDSIWTVFNANKTIFENLTAKEPEGLIERVKKINSKGANPEERKLNATFAVMNYKDENGNKVNLYELLDEMRERYNFTKSLMDGITYKNSVLITMLGSLKLEK